MEVLQACRCDHAPTGGINDLPAVSRGYPKASSGQIVLSRQCYWFGLAIVALAFFAETALTWRKWSTLIGDVGTELYLPWRLSEGAVLYRDLYFFAGGPFSQYFMALLFKIFGASFLTLALSNLTASGVMLLIIFRHFAKAADTWTAATICFGIIVVFAFGFYFYEGFNYVAPYSTEAVHGLILSVITVGALSNWISKCRVRYAALAGFCSGLVFLTKPDIFLALAACQVAAFGLLVFSFRKGGFALRSIGPFLIAGMIAPLFFLFFFLRVESWHDSVRSVVFAWVPLFDAAVIKQPFYQACVGLDWPYFHLKNLLFQSALVASVSAFYAAAFRLVKNHQGNWIRIQQRAVPGFAPVLLILIYADHWRQSGQAFSGSFLMVLVYLWLFLAVGVFLLSAAMSKWKPIVYRSPWAVMLMLIAPVLISAYDADWVDCGYSLPLAALASCAAIFSNRHTLAGQQKLIFPFLWSVFALVLLSKLGLFPRIWEYGFVLAMPAFVSGIYFLMWLLPLLLEKKWQVPRRYFRTTAWVILVIGFWTLFHQSVRNFASQNVAVDSNGDKMMTSDAVEHARIYSATLAWLQTNVPPDATVAAVPQGAIINYLARRVNPTPCVFWDPNIMSVFGQATMTSAFERSAPDYVIIVERRVGLIDQSYFGSPGYGFNLMQWIRRNYQTQVLIGHEPLENGAFGIKILKRVINKTAQPGKTQMRPISRVRACETNYTG